ncbi:hypothetical protein Clacol_007249 [Clathrus columnatus]|uniref:Uncharacterized protein n=1 Tax=Clathrus columnatus TaxID=1419009 RepID=A0AAV5AM42_9AGAM|nr:hypothetical protein Clacol_007249 [Clathrus columnatus]
MPPRAKRSRTEGTNLVNNSDDEDLFDTTPIQLPSFMTDNVPLGGSSRGTAGVRGASALRPVEPMVLEDDHNETHVTQLMRHWMNERLSPDLLQHCGDLLQTLLDRIRDQAIVVSQLRGDPDANEDEHYQIILVQTEMERIRFIIRSYTRTRIQKVSLYNIISRK